MSSLEEENKRLRTALQVIESCCMWAFDLGSSVHNPKILLPETRCDSYAHHLQTVRVHALKALYPERINENFDSLIFGDPYLKREKDRENVTPS